MNKQTKKRWKVFFINGTYEIALSKSRKSSMQIARRQNKSTCPGRVVCVELLEEP